MNTSEFSTTSNDSELSRPVMIFHTAYALNPHAKSASGIRPIRMRDAFHEAGYEVLEVTGTHGERRQLMRELKKRIEQGLQIEFVYSESSTAPTGIGEPVTIHTSFSRDLKFLHFCSTHNIPVGIFYRDVYWKFPIYDELVPRPLSDVLKYLYRTDLKRYRKFGFTIFLPSREMQEYVPIVASEQFSELPPGGSTVNFKDATQSSAKTGQLEILYVGGLGSNYRLLESVREVGLVSNVQLTICTREAEWQANQAEYEPYMRENIRVVHQSGSELELLYAKADMCLLAVEPVGYWNFAVPMKLMEYVSYGKPIIASADTYCARFVSEQHAGWVVEYGAGQLTTLLQQLASNPEEVQSITDTVQKLAPAHSWRSRAKSVADQLSRSGKDSEVNS